MFLHLYEESSEKQKVDSNYFEVNWVSDFGEKLPGASLVMSLGLWLKRVTFFLNSCVQLLIINWHFIS
jgi:hypothetical protein